MTNHENPTTFCEIRNSVKILLGLVSHRVSTVNGFWWNVVGSNDQVYAVGGNWIITYVKKIWQYKCVHDKASMLYLEVSIIVKWISYMKMVDLLGAANML